jgi:hypothetical protein
MCGCFSPWSNSSRKTSSERSASETKTHPDTLEKLGDDLRLVEMEYGDVDEVLFVATRLEEQFGCGDRESGCNFCDVVGILHVAEDTSQIRLALVQLDR